MVQLGMSLLDAPAYFHLRRKLYLALLVVGSLRIFLMLLVKELKITTRLHFELGDTPLILLLFDDIHQMRLTFAVHVHRRFGRYHILF